MEGHPREHQPQDRRRGRGRPRRGRGRLQPSARQPRPASAVRRRDRQSPTASRQPPAVAHGRRPRARVRAWFAAGSQRAAPASCRRQPTTGPSARLHVHGPGGLGQRGDQPASTGCSRTRPPTRPRSRLRETARTASSLGPTTARSPSATRRADHRGATAAEIVAALRGQRRSATTEPVDVTIGGLTGKQIDVQLDPDWTASCPGDTAGADLGDQRTRAILLDSARCAASS